LAKNYRKIHRKLPLKELLFRLFIGIIVVLFICTCIQTYRISGKFLPTRELLTDTASIRFIDVGQGDATLIMTGTHSVLVDTGTNFSANALVTYLQTYVGKIDYMILTHPHDDHTGGAEEILKAMKVNHIIAPEIPNDNYYAYLNTLASTYKFTLHKATPGDIYTAGDITVHILAPIRTNYENVNDASIAARIETGGVSLLCTGDAEQIAEADILAAADPALLDCDIYQTGHHGSSTSTSMEFYYAVSPDICVISCGKGNTYGHPHSTVVSLIELSGAELYRTDLQGTIILDIQEGQTTRRSW